MTGSVDNRIVAMEFDNADFEKKLSSTLAGLSKLDESLKLQNASAGFDEVQKAAGRFDTSSVVSSIDNISKKFSAMGAVGFSVISNLTDRVLGFAANMFNAAKTDILGPIITGGTTRAQNIEQAQFQFRGLGMDVAKSMGSALDAVKGTAYGLDEAAKIASQFGASGVKAGTQMTSYLRGVAGTAAMTGSTFSEIGDIFAQSAASGKVGTMDLEQFSTRGLNAAAAVAKQIGKTEAQVRDMASHGQLDFNTFATAMDKAFGSHATAANETYSGSLANLHAAMSRLGAAFEQTKLTQQRDLFNTLSPAIDNITTALKPMINAILDIRGDAIRRLIADIKGFDLSGITKGMPFLADGLKNIFKAVDEIISTVKEEFKTVFPPATANQIVEMSKAFDNFTKKLIPSKDTLEKIKLAFDAVFYALDIGKAVIKGVIGVFETLLGNIFGRLGAGGGALDLLDKLGIAMINLDKFLVGQGRIQSFFMMIDHAIADAFEWIVKAASAVENFVNKAGIAGAVTVIFAKMSNVVHEVATWFENLHGGISKTTDAAGPAAAVADRISERYGFLLTTVQRVVAFFSGGAFDGVKRVFDDIGRYIANWMSQLGHNIAASLKPGDFDAAVDSVNVGLLGGILLLLKRFTDSMKRFDLSGGIVAKIQSILGQLQNTLKTMQTELKAEALEKIAIAIGVVAASVFVLSLIDSDKLTKAMIALAVGMRLLVQVMKDLDSMASNSMDAGKFAILAAGMDLMATAALILSAAVAAFGHMSLAELAKGLGGITAALSIMVAVSHTMNENALGMLAAGAAMIPLATGLTILAGTVSLFGHMSWETMGKGMLALVGVLVILDAAVSTMPIPSVLAAGLAMIPLATGITILAGALKIFGTFSWSEMARGLVALAGTLIIISAAMEAMPLTLPITAAGLVLVGISLTIMAGAMRLFGGMSWGEIGKGLASIAGLLLILGAALETMTGTLAGAAALIVSAAALSVLADVLKTLGGMSWGDIVRGLVAIAGVFVVLGLAGLVLEPVIPAILGLGAAMLLVGAGFALFGAGAWLVVHAIEAMAAAGDAGVKALVIAFDTLLAAIPTFTAVLLASLIKSAGDILNSAQLMLKILTVLLVQILDTVIKMAPKIAEALVAIITSALELIRAKFPDVVETAFDLLMAFLKGIQDHEVQILDEAIAIISRFAHTMTLNAQLLVDAAVNLITSILNAIDSRMGDVAAAGLNLLLSFIAAEVNNLYRVIDFAVTLVITLAQTIGNEVGRIVDAGAHVLIKFIEGVGRDIQNVSAKGTDIIIALMQAISGDVVRIANAAGDTLVHFLNSLADSIRVHSPEIRAAGWDLAGAIIDGITGGLLDPGNIAKAVGAVKNVAKSIIDGAKHILGIGSPSKAFAEIGGFVMQGMAQGIENDPSAEASVVSKAEAIVKAFQDTLSTIPTTLEGMDAFNPKITPVLDLSKVHAGAKTIGSLMQGATITPGTSYAQANIISTTADVAGVPPKDPLADQPKQVVFNQTINAPTALSTNDIYKQTNSQLARAKEELNI